MAILKQKLEECQQRLQEVQLTLATVEALDIRIHAKTDVKKTTPAGRIDVKLLKQIDDVRAAVQKAIDAKTRAQQEFQQFFEKKEQIVRIAMIKK